MALRSFHVLALCWPSDSDSFIFQSPYQISWIPQACCHILRSTLRAKPLVSWTQSSLSLLFFKRCRHPVINASNLSSVPSKTKASSKGERDTTSSYERKHRVQVAQSMNRWGLVFVFAWSWNLGGVGGRSYSTSRTDLKKMLISLSTCLNCFLGPMNILKLSLLTCFVQNCQTYRACFKSPYQELAEVPAWSISIRICSGAFLIWYHDLKLFL